MTALRRHPQLRPAVIAVGLALVLTAAAAAVVGLLPFDHLADQLAAEAVVIAAGTFLLASVAGMLALVAFAQSLQRPSVKVWFRFRFRDRTPQPPGEERAPQRSIQALSAVRGEAIVARSTWPEVWVLPPGSLDLTVANSGEVTARNVVVTVTIHELLVPLDNALPPGWICLEHDTQAGVTSLQWDGGADLAVHPQVPRSLPDVILESTCIRPGGNPWVRVSVVADSAPRRDDTHELLPITPPPEPREPDW
jgi:hypothetical protein